MALKCPHPEEAAKRLSRRTHSAAPAIVQGFTSLVTERLPRGPPADQPPIMPENIPASPPARTIKRPPGRNLLTVLPASEGGPPSAMPLAPATRSAPGISHS